MENQFEQEAKDFCEAIKSLANDETRLDNLQSYLSNHFRVWLEVWASTPEGIASEMKHFAEMEF